MFWRATKLRLKRGAASQARPKSSTCSDGGEKGAGPAKGQASFTVHPAARSFCVPISQFGIAAFVGYGGVQRGGRRKKDGRDTRTTAQKSAANAR